MTDRPIIFSAPMVRALLEGRKTQTRRVFKGIPDLRSRRGEWQVSKIGGHGCYDRQGRQFAERSCLWHTGTGETHVPIYAPGDRLWVREAWGRTNNVNDQENWPGRPHVFIGPGEAAIYRADGGWRWCDGDGFSTERSMWRPSIHMPRWASRLTLHVEAVRVQRLLDISDTDAQAEGVYWNAGLGGWCTDTEGRNYHGQWPTCAFEKLWDTIHGDGASDANPWVAAITFRVEHKNIDANPTTPTAEAEHEPS